MKNFALFLFFCALSQAVFSQEKLTLGHQNELVVQLQPGTNPHSVIHASNSKSVLNWAVGRAALTLSTSGTTAKSSAGSL